MSQTLLCHLQRAEQGMTVAELCALTGLTPEAAWLSLAELARGGWVIGCARPNRAPLFYPITRLGECDWCGLVDHHLVASMCPGCMARSTGLGKVAPRIAGEALPAIPGTQAAPARRTA
ncbi:MAG: hypothetical protein WD118_06790 [Phycisphaeraceae bacterium]